VIFELIQSLRVRCPSFARKLGLSREHVLIAARHKRVSWAWAPHLAASKAAILEGAALCPRRRRALVIGAGDCLDVPVGELAELFSEVVLADVAIGIGARRWERRLEGRVRCALWDATGALEALAAYRDKLDREEAARVLAGAQPGIPPLGEPDLVVSANCLSQLGLIPGYALAAAKDDEGLPDHVAVAAAKRHLAWLEERDGVRVLLADVARLNISPDDGRVLKEERLIESFGLPAPDRTWRWNLAPIPEWNSTCHRVHEVGVWITAPVASRPGASTIP